MHAMQASQQLPPYAQLPPHVGRMPLFCSNSLLQHALQDWRPEVPALVVTLWFRCVTLALMVWPLLLLLTFSFNCPTSLLRCVLI
jgi:hypothetical protein